ncbi:MAG TPA: tetratricopeptide repeat protein, partial [Thermoanaerobaculia bacterium]|nr:tetratricopeptide repeat protein [Thermoanaerobaculia bacterium]
VDKIPTAGAVTQVILANHAVTEFGKAVDLEPSWLALFTRGNSYLYWPRVFGRTPLAVADLERAVALGQREGKRPYQVRAWIALGDAYWKLDRPEEARKTWQQALAEFPANARLLARLGKEGEELRTLIEEELDPNRRVDTDLSALWEER